MNAPAFNIATCSDQDFNTRLAHYSSRALRSSVDLASRGHSGLVPMNDLYSSFAKHLHLAMGHRPDQLEV